MSVRAIQICSVSTAIIRLFALAKTTSALYKGG